jgi:hypothetical protein
MLASRVITQIYSIKNIINLWNQEPKTQAT